MEWVGGASGFADWRIKIGALPGTQQQQTGRLWMGFIAKLAHFNKTSEIKEIVQLTDIN